MACEWGATTLASTKEPVIRVRTKARGERDERKASGGLFLGSLEGFFLVLVVEF